MPEKKTNKQKKLIINTLCAAIVFLSFLSALPSILSTSWGTRQLVWMINQGIDGEVKVKNITLGWFGTKKIDRLEYRDSSGNRQIAIRSLRSTAPLLDILSGTLSSGETEVSGVNAVFKQQRVAKDKASLRPASTQIESPITTSSIASKNETIALTPSLPAETFTFKIPFCGRLNVRDSQITIEESDNMTASLKYLEGTLDVPYQPHLPATFFLSGLSDQEGMEGKFAVEGKVDGLNNKREISVEYTGDGLHMAREGTHIELKAKLQNVSVSAFDFLFSLKDPSYQGYITSALGEKINLIFEGDLQHENGSVALRAESPNLRGNIGLKTNKDSFVFSNSTFAELQITPNFFEKLTKIGLSHSRTRQLTLQEPAVLSFTLDRGNFENKGTKVGSLRVNFDLQTTRLKHRHSPELIVLNTTHGFIEKMDSDDGLLLSLGGLLNYREREGSFHVEGRWSEFFGHEKSQRGEWKVETKAFPTSLLHAVTTTRRSLLDDIGPTFDMRLNASGSKDQWLLGIRFGSEYLTIPSAEFKLEKSLTLLHPAKARLEITPTSFKQTIGQESDLALVDRVSVIANVQSFSLPLNQEWRWDDAIADIEVASAPFILKGLLDQPQGMVKISNFRGQIKGSSLAQATYDFNGNIAPDAHTALYQTIFGKVSAIHLRGRLQSHDGNHLAFTDTSFALSNDQLNLEAVGVLDEKQHFTLTAPAVLKWNISPESLDLRLLGGIDSPELTHPSHLALRVDKAQFSLNKENPLPLAMSGKLELPTLSLKERSPDRSTSTLSDLDLSWEYDGRDKQATFTLSAKSSFNEGHRGRVEAKGTVNQWDENNIFSPKGVSIHTQGVFEQLPTSLIAVLSNDHQIRSVLGQAVNLSFDINLDPSHEDILGNVTAILKGNQVQGQVDLLLDKDLTLTNKGQPLKFDLAITPQIFRSIAMGVNGNKEPHWDLEETAMISAELPTFRFPLRDLFPEDGQEASWLPEKMVGKINISPFQLVNKNTGDQIPYREMALSLNKPSEQSALQFKANAFGSSRDSQLEAWGEIYSLNRLNPRFEVQLNGQNMPFGVLTRVMGENLEISSILRSLLGEKMDVSSRFELQDWSGLLLLEAKGTDGTISLNSYIRDGIGYLKQPLVVTSTLTPRALNLLSNKYLPVLSSVQSIPDPIRLTILPDGFSVPIREPSPYGLRIARGSFEMGQMNFRSDSQISLAFNLLGGSKEAFDRPSFPIWFTPLYFSYVDGVFKLNRADALVADKFPIAFWGFANIPGNKVNFTLGLTARALYESYGIKNLSNDYVLQLPIVGTLNNASLDSATAIARVSVLVTKSQAGPFTNIIEFVAGEDEAAPPPTTNPLPWQDEVNGVNSTVEQKPSKFNKLEKKLEQGLNGLKGFFK